MRTYTTPAGNKEPRPFKINDTEFKCKPNVSADTLRLMFLCLCGDERGTITWEDHLRPFFGYVMEDDELARFEEFTKDQDNIVHADFLYRIAQDLYEEFAGVPFDALFASLSSRLTDGKNSSDDSPSKEPASTL